MGGPGAPAGQGQGQGSNSPSVSPSPSVPGLAAETPARTPLRRLTHEQYNNAIRDLLGLTGDFAQGFDPDEVAGTFASNLSATVSSVQVDQYRQAAEQVAAQAVAGAGLARLAPCAPPAGAAAACATQFLADFGKRAFRRPLTPDETTRYAAVYTAGAGASSDFAGGITLLISALLQSPNFLYMPELGDATAASSMGLPLTQYELASRLSFMVLGSTPDDALLQAADSGQLATVDGIAAEVKRMIAAPAGRSALVSFHRNWLELSEMMTTQKDSKFYPTFTPQLLQAMSDEIGAFVQGVVSDGDGTLATLLSANFSFPTAPLYPIYGLPAPTSTTAATVATRVDLPAGQRSGLFTLPGVMSVYAHTDQSAPVARGFLVSDKLLCVTPPPPPPNVNTTVPPPDPNLSARQRLAAHRQLAQCNSCHGLMDPYGLTFEMYDGIGRFRTTDGNLPVDPSGNLPTVGAVKNAVDLLGKLSQTDQVRQCVVTQWFRYGFGRVEAKSDNPTLAVALNGFAQSGYRIPDLVEALASTNGFRYRSPLIP
jgi:hypothetical protein